MIRIPICLSVLFFIFLLNSFAFVFILGRNGSTISLCTYCEYIKLIGEGHIVTQKRAFFVRWPRMLSEIRRVHGVECLRAFVIEKTIVLQKIDYINFISDMTVERKYLQKYRPLCRIDARNVWHCLLVRCAGRRTGLLIMPSRGGFPYCAAVFWRKRTY